MWPPLSLALLSAWVFGLLAVIWAFTGGAWLLRLAFPIAGACLALVWVVFAALYWLPANGCLKAGVAVLAAAWSIPLGNALAAALLGQDAAPTLAGYFAWGRIFAPHSAGGQDWVNQLVFLLALVTALGLLLAGAVLEVRRRRPASRA